MATHSTPHNENTNHQMYHTEGNDSGVKVTFQPLFHSESPTKNITPFAYLLQIDDLRILLDCGWSSSLDLRELETILPAIAQSGIDIVLLSHASLAHSGGLPYLLSAACGRPQPLVLSSLPVHRLAQMYLYDAVESRRLVDPEWRGITLEDIDTAFALVGDTEFSGGSGNTTASGNTHTRASGCCDTVRYFEERVMRGVTMVCAPAGHTLGGSVWRISKGSEAIVYAVDFNHRGELHGERHLGRCSLSLMGVPVTDTAMTGSATPSTVIASSTAVAACVSAVQRRPTVFITDAACGTPPGVLDVATGSGNAVKPMDERHEGNDKLNERNLSTSSPSLASITVGLPPPPASGLSVRLLQRPVSQSPAPNKSSTIPLTAMRKIESKSNPDRRSGNLKGGEGANSLTDTTDDLNEGLNDYDDGEELDEKQLAHILDPTTELPMATFSRDDTRLLTTLFGALAEGGSVLLPTDSAGRCLELLLRLDSAWSTTVVEVSIGAATPAVRVLPNATYPLVFCNPVAPNTLEFARTMLEYMSEKLTQTFSTLRTAPFHVKPSRLATSITALDARTAGKPSVILASHASLETGFSHTLLPRLLSDARNVILFTDRGDIHAESVAAQLLWVTQMSRGTSTSSASTVATNPIKRRRGGGEGEELEPASILTFTQTIRVPLTPSELAQQQANAVANVPGRVATTTSLMTAPKTAANGMIQSLTMTQQEQPKPLMSVTVPHPTANATHVVTSAGIAAPATSTMSATTSLGVAKPSPTSSTSSSLPSSTLSSAPYVLVDDADAIVDDADVPLPRARFAATRELNRMTHPPHSANAVMGTPASSSSTSTPTLPTTKNSIDTSQSRHLPSTSSASAATPVATASSPTKLVTREVTVPVLCRVGYIDVEGRIDSRESLRHIVEAIAPRSLVLVRGKSVAGTQTVATACAPYCARLFIPTDTNHALDVSSHGDVLTVSLADELYDATAFQKAGGYEVAHIDAILSIDNAVATLLPRNTDRECRQQGHTLSLLRQGAIRLPELKKRLERAGILSEMLPGGCLVTKGGVLLQRKSNLVGGSGIVTTNSSSSAVSDGKSSSMLTGTNDLSHVVIQALSELQLEGPPSDDYYRVRAALYHIFTVV